MIGVKDGKLYYYVGSLEGWSPKKKQYIGRNCLKREGGGGVGQLADLREEAWQEREQCILCRLLALSRLGFATLLSWN